MNALPKKDEDRVNSICTICMDELKAALREESTYMVKLEELRKSMEDKFEEIKAQLGKNIQDQFDEIKSQLGKLDDVGKGMCEVVSAVENLAEAEPGALTVSGAESADPRPWMEVVKRKRKKKKYAGYQRC